MDMRVAGRTMTTMRRPPISVRIALAAGGIMLTTCGGDKPADSTPPVTQTIAAPVPAAAATPIATATPLPGTSCNLPAVTREADRCTRESSGVFIPQVDDAIARLMSQRPDIFAGTAIRDMPAFRVGVLQNLEAAGLCAQWDADREGHREIMVKNANSFSEQYHIEQSNGQVRTGLGAYRATCYPANFPISPEPLPARGDCKLPSSREYGCDRLEAPQFLGLMDATATEIARSRPDLVRDGYVVGDVNVYYREMTDRLIAKGYCAVFDSEEIALKNANDFSEQYHVVLSSGRQRLGLPSYRSTCRPAAF